MSVKNPDLSLIINESMLIDDRKSNVSWFVFLCILLRAVAQVANDRSSVEFDSRSRYALQPV